MVNINKLKGINTTFININVNNFSSTGEPGDKDHETVNNAPTKSIGELNGGTSVSRNVSCVADTKSEREVVVECFAPYDDHR